MNHYGQVGAGIGLGDDKNVERWVVASVKDRRRPDDQAHCSARGMALREYGVESPAMVVGRENLNVFLVRAAQVHVAELAHNEAEAVRAAYDGLDRLRHGFSDRRGFHRLQVVRRLAGDRHALSRAPRHTPP